MNAPDANTRRQLRRLRGRDYQNSRTSTYTLGLLARLNERIAPPAAGVDELIALLAIQQLEREGVDVSDLETLPPPHRPRPEDIGTGASEDVPPNDATVTRRTIRRRK